MSKPIPGENVVKLNPQGGFPFQLFSDLTAGSVAKRHLIKGGFARGETSAWIAPPGGMKSALMAEASVCVAGGLDWHGYKNKGAAGVVYFALERADLVRRRLQAHRERAKLGNLPIAVVGSIVDLMAPATVAMVTETLKQAEESFGCSVGLVIFDTFAKLIAAGGGDEDKARDQGRVFSNIQRVKEAADIHVAIVGHTGKDESRGMRGSNAALGDADTMNTISGDLVRTVTVTKANDGPEGPLFSFKSEVHEFGVDEDGDMISVNIVSDAKVEQSSGGSSRKTRKLPNAALICQRALHEAMIESGIVAPPSAEIPVGQRIVPIKEWRRLAYSRGVSGSSEGRARELAFKRSMETLVAVQAVGVWDDFAWCV